jgi:DNA-binding NarL/FixJ family response regulator
VTSARSTTPPRTPPIRILLVDDSRQQREGFRMLLGSQPEFEVVGQAGDGAQALAHARRDPADVVLMDIQMPRVNGLAATERILGDEQVRGLGRLPRVVLLASVDLEDHVPAAAVAGAYAVLYKDVQPEQLFETIREAAAYRGEE